MDNNFRDDQAIFTTRLKRRRINEIGAILSEWYGEEQAKDELKAYFPKVVSAGEIAKKIVSNENYQEIELLTKIQSAWPEIVGQEISANSKPVSVKNSSLTIEAKNYAWLSELKNFYSKMIEMKLNSSFKQLKLKKIIFVSAGK